GGTPEAKHWALPNTIAAIKKCRKIRGNRHAGFKWKCLTSSSAMAWTSRCASANRPNPAARTSTPLAPSSSAMIRSPAFADSLDMDRQTLCQLPLLGGDQWRSHNLLGQKPDLELVG